jgi:hypothetical protein
MKYNLCNILSGVAVVAALTASGFLTTTNAYADTICAMDAKQCPDGSYVSRIAPSCEFALCPKAFPIGLFLPDLIVTHVNYNTGIFTATVKNQGSAAAAVPAGTVIGVSFFVNNKYIMRTALLGPLAIGASKTVTIGTYRMATGIYTIMAYADDKNVLKESNETNNQRSTQILTTLCNGCRATGL